MGLGGLQILSGHFGEDKCFLALLETKLQFLGHPAYRHSLKKFTLKTNQI
jgi:hypothetical protein